MRSTSVRAIQEHRRAFALIATGVLALGSAASLATGLVSCAPQEKPAAPTRPLNAVEAGRLATMRLHNFQDGRVGIRGSFGKPDELVHVAGWIDWQRPLAYFSVTGKQTGAADGLVQARPGVIAFRPGRINGTEPPAGPPADGWRVRPFAKTGPAGAPLDTMLLLLFTIAVNQTDTADLLVRSEARWLGSDTVDGVPVDVLLGPAVPPRPTSPAPVAPFQPSASPSPTPSPGTLAAQGGAVRYWLDSDARLRRLAAIVGADSPLQLDFARTDRRELAAIAELGGRTIAPRRPTTAEADTLSRLRQRNRTVGTTTLTVALPSPEGNLTTATGWLDWRNGFAYLAVRDTSVPDKQALVRVDRTGVSTLTGAPLTKDGRPPVPPPRGGWQRSAWEDRSDEFGARDFDLLLSEALGMSAASRDDPAYLRSAAVWLRADTIGGTQVAVYEIPKPEERGLPAGNARMRYWIDTSGVLRRVEVRSRTGGYGRLELNQAGPTPYVGPVR
jgi:hypothetical protein